MPLELVELLEILDRFAAVFDRTPKVSHAVRIAAHQRMVFLDVQMSQLFVLDILSTDGAAEDLVVVHEHGDASFALVFGPVGPTAKFFSAFVALVL